MATPRVGIHAARTPFLDLALWDIVGTAVGSALVVWFVLRLLVDPKRPLDWASKAMAYVAGFALLWLAGIVVHLQLGIKTPVTTGIDRLFEDMVQGL